MVMLYTILLKNVMLIKNHITTMGQKSTSKKLWGLMSDHTITNFTLYQNFQMQKSHHLHKGFVQIIQKSWFSTSINLSAKAVIF